MRQVALFLEDGNLKVDADGDPDLSSNRVRGDTVKGFDSEVLLNPPKEEFDLPLVEASLNVSQTLAIGELSEAHG